MEARTMIILAAIIIIFSPVAFVLLMNPAPNPGPSSASASVYSYTVFQSAGTYYAVNGITGVIDYTSSNGSYVISQAIQNVPHDGGTVFLKSGNYALTSPIVTGRSLFTLQGEHSNLPWAAQGGAKITKTGNFDLLQIQGTSSSVRYGSIVIKDISLGNLGGSGNAINASYTSDIQIDNVYIGSFQNSAFYAYSCYAPRIFNCYSVMNGADTVSPDINITGNAGAGVRSTAAMVHNNIFENPNYCAVSIDYCDGAMIKDNWGEMVYPGTTSNYFIVNCRDADISGNQLISCSNDAIVLLNGATSPKITNNWIAAEGYGLSDNRTLPSGGGSITSNSFEGCGRGLSVSNLVIVDSNQIGYSGHEGINITGDYNVISNNQIFKNGQAGNGIQAGVYNYNGRWNSISENSFWDSGSPISQLNCYRESNSVEYNSIIGNIMKDSTTKVALSVSSDSVVRDNLGFATEAWGYVTMNGSATTVTFTYRMNITADYFFLQAKLQDSVNIVVTSWTATTITITASASSVGAYDIFWYAASHVVKDWRVFP